MFLVTREQRADIHRVKIFEGKMVIIFVIGIKTKKWSKHIERRRRRRKIDQEQRGNTKRKEH